MQVHEHFKISQLCRVAGFWFARFSHVTHRLAFGIVRCGSFVYLYYLCALVCLASL